VQEEKTTVSKPIDFRAVALAGFDAGPPRKLSKKEREERIHICAYAFAASTPDLLRCLERPAHFCYLQPDRRERVLGELLALGWLRGSALAEAQAWGWLRTLGSGTLFV
jgi:hypothetical protein